MKKRKFTQNLFKSGIILLFLIPITLAQSNLDISLIEYNPETNFARIQITNNLPQDLHNVKFQINTLPTIPVNSILKPGTAAIQVLNVPKGIHTITITADETTETKDLSFQASIQEKQEEFEKAQRAKRRDIQKTKVKEQELEKNKPIMQERKSYNKYIIPIIVILALAIIAYFLLKKKK